MITWPIFVALILSIAAVYYQIKREDEQAAKEQAEEDERQLKNENENENENEEDEL